MIKSKKNCAKCRWLLDLTNFSIQRTGKVNSTCNGCIEKVRAHQEQNKCPHGRQKHICKECGGTSICEHGRQKHICIECDGTSFASTKKEKRKCKICSDPIKVTIKNWISGAIQSDKKHNRFDPDRFIDTDFCRGLIKDYPRCFYPDCKAQMQFLEHKNDLCTIERLDNKIGHIKSNGVLCCLKCNLARKSDKLIVTSYKDLKASS